MKLLKAFTTRNAFSREYGTWLIVLFNFAFVPLLIQEITIGIIVFFVSIFFFLMFRFELLDYLSTKIQNVKKTKIYYIIIYLILSIYLFLFLVIEHIIEIRMAGLISVLGICMIALNIITRRKKGKRQNVSAQIILVCFVAFLGALNYYLLTGIIDKIFFSVFLFNALFFSNSIIYVRSKTMGSPFDTYALLFSILTIILVVVLSSFSIVKITMIIVFIPTLIKTLDNVILYNVKVPLRRIGINETFHCIVYVFLSCLIFNMF